MKKAVCQFAKAVNLVLNTSSKQKVRFFIEHLQTLVDFLHNGVF